MGAENKREIFSALISSQITYHAVSLQCTNKTSLRILQRIHNRGARFNTGISKLERRTSKYIYERAQLKLVNVILYERALTIQNKIRTNLREEFEGVYTYRAPSRKDWPLSIPVVLEEEPPTIYVQKREISPEMEMLVRGMCVELEGFLCERRVKE